MRSDLLDVPQYKMFHLLPFLMLSCMLHLAFLFLLPDLTRLFNIHIKQLLPLSQVEIEVALINPELKARPEPKPAPEVKASQPAPSLLTDDRIAALIDMRVRNFSALGETSLRSPAQIELPPATVSNEINAPQIEPPLTAPKVPSRELLGRLGQKSLGRLSGRRLEGTLDDDSRKAVLDLDEILAADAKKALLKVDSAAAKVSRRDYGLSGPVARNREVLFRPGLPKVTLVRDVTVGFRFWVRPDGSVSRVETHKIGDLELVNVAERYLKQWRFSSLPAESPQEDQWGTVKIIFRVPR